MMFRCTDSRPHPSARQRRTPRPTVVAVALLALLALTLASASAFPNQGFESGLAGWSSVDTTVVGTQTVNVSCGSTGALTWTVSPFADGSQMARLAPASTIMSTAAWAQLGLSAATITYLNGVFPNSTDYAIVYRDLDLVAGDSFVMAWNYVATDYAPFNDGSFVTLINVSDATAPLPLINGLVGDLQVLGVTVDNGTGTYVTGDCGSTGWQTTSFEVRYTGTYRLGFAAFNLTDTVRSPIVFVDEAAGGTLRNGEDFPPIPPSPTPPPPQVLPDAVVTTGAVTSIGANGAQVAGSVTNIGTGPLVQHGHVWSTATNPTVNLATRTELGGLSGPSSFTSTVVDLSPETTYYVRAYATNAHGTSYGDVVTFATGSACQAVTTPTALGVSDVATTSATLSWTAASGTAPITYHWSVQRAADGAVEATGQTSATAANASGLTPGVTYHARVFAENCGGASAVITSAPFTTLKLAQSPVLATLDALEVHYGDSTTVRASGGSGSGAYEFRQNDGTGTVHLTGTGADRTVTGTSVGTAVIEARRLGDATYLDSAWVTAGSLTIAARPITVTANDAWKVYALPPVADPVLPWSVTAGNLVAGDAISGAPSREAGEHVGTYTIGQGTLTAGPNYALTFVAGTFAIRHAQPDHLVTIAAAGPQTAGAPFSLVSITAVDRYGHVADGANGALAYAGAKTLTYTLSGDLDGPTAGVDAFTTSVTFVAGVATATLTTVLHRAQTTTITAHDADLPTVESDVPSAPFDVVHATADHLRFRTEPATTRAAVPFAAPPSAEALDAYGNLATSFAGSVTFEALGATASLEPSAASTVAAQAGVATLACHWVDAPALRLELEARSAGLTSARSVRFDVTGALVRGVVYVDVTAAGTRPPGAPPIAGAHVGLVDADGEPVSWPDGGTLDGAVCTARETDVSITDALGRYRAPGLDAGTFELVVRGDPSDGSVDVAGVTTTLTSLARVGSDPFEITAPAFGRYEVDVGFFPGAFVEGVVFRDDGGATGDGLSGRANDAERDPAESGVGGVVIVSLPEGVRAVASGPDGRYRLALPMTEATSVTVGHDRGRASGHTLTSGTDVTTVLAAGTVGHYASFAALPGGVYQLDFGLVPPLRLVGDGAQSVTSPGVARFELLLEPGTPGEVRLEALHGSEAWTVRLDPSDSACAEALAVEGDGGVWRLIGAWPQHSDGALLPCPVLVDLHVPSGRPVGDVQDLLLRAVSSWERPDGAPAVSDASGTSLLRTTVVDAGRVTLRFDASSDGGDTFAARVEAAPRTAVLYRVRYGNPGTQPVRDVAVRVPIDSAYLAPPVSGPLGIVAVVCPDHGQPAAVTTLPYDAVTRLITLDLEGVCGISELAPGASGELLVELELR